MLVVFRSYYAFAKVKQPGIMRKPTFCICIKTKTQISCATAQADQFLCFHFLNNRISLVSIS